MSMSALAPITLFVYNRPSHTRQTLEALMANELADKSKLIIYSDGAKKDSTTEDINKIKEIRKLIREKKWCGEVEIVEADKNKGLAASIVSGVTEVINKYGKIIVLEDDLVTSRFFLKFMNEALALYENEEKVAAIHGYMFPLKEKLQETFFLNDTGCWGWGTWKHAWDLFESNGSALLHELENQNLSEKFDYDNSYPYMQMLKDQIEGRNSSWAIRWYASIFLKEKLTLYPGKSLVRNIGSDGSGEHGSSKFINVVLSDIPAQVEKIEIKENVYVRNLLSRLFKSWFALTFSKRLKRFVYNRFIIMIRKLGLSKTYWSRRFKNVTFGNGVQITGVKDIEIGSGCCISDNVWLNTNIRNKGITLKIGECVLLGRGTLCSSYDLIEIGAYTSTLANVLITNSYQPFNDINQPYLQCADSKGNLIIEENCWFGMNSVVYGGITIGRGCVIGANSLVTSDLPAFSIVKGNPHKIIKMYNSQTKQWENTKNQEAIDTIINIREQYPLPSRSEYLSILKENAIFKIADPVCAGREIWI